MKSTIPTIAFPIFCLLFSFAILFADQNFTLSLLDEKAVPATQQLLQYFWGTNSMPQVFTSQEQAHLRDVKIVIWIALILLLATIAILYSQRQHFMTITLNGTLLLSPILGVSAVIPFDIIFTNFHHIFFPNGNWIFPPNSTLIQYYPFTFFRTYAIAIAGHAMLTALFLLGLSRTVEK
ncbi:DUF1461 domain-containing protein [Candidatus Woesearchaeota archaeon]|nr:DUF1461 domain-containing protein [Candidatus Woesearchaeota archaeon]